MTTTTAPIIKHDDHPAPTLADAMLRGVRSPSGRCSDARALVPPVDQLLPRITRVADENGLRDAHRTFHATGNSAPYRAALADLTDVPIGNSPSAVGDAPVEDSDDYTPEGWIDGDASGGDTDYQTGENV